MTISLDQLHQDVEDLYARPSGEALPDGSAEVVERVLQATQVGQLLGTRVGRDGRDAGHPGI